MPACGNLSASANGSHPAPKARQSKSKARINKYNELVDQAAERKPTDTQIVIPIAERLGKVVIEAENLSKGFDDRQLIENLSFKLPAGGIVGIIGPNGAGKSTLFKMITGQEHPGFSGTIRIGETVKLGYVDQSRDSLDADKTVWEEITGGAEVIKLGKHQVNSRGLCRQLQFPQGRPTAEGRDAVGRSAQPGASGEDVEIRRQTYCCSTNRPMISIPRRYLRWKMRWRSSGDARS